MYTNEIRQAFLDFFAARDHKIVQSSSLIPHNDPTIMFVNSGMVQFKNYFLQLESPPHANLCSVQKCVRAGGKHNDLENVGYTARHHTFFEMLGNFSFGGYFKEKAIDLAWTFLTTVLKIPQSKLYVTVFHEDHEAYEIWSKIIDSSHIIKISTNDNFWSAGKFGPCGPCSEIFYDHGEKYAGGLPGTENEDGDRYVEIWNMVFMQYNMREDGVREALATPAIDTGMGLERIAAVMQNVNNNFDIDSFSNIIKASINLSNKSGDTYQNAHLSPSHKIIADHLKSASFLIADGIMPSNEGRGYVLRRIIRRALRHVFKVGAAQSHLAELLPYLLQEMVNHYAELQRGSDLITAILNDESKKFWDILSKGEKIMNDAILQSTDNIISGALAFKLYDSYGFPIEIIKEIAQENGKRVNDTEFDKLMEEQRQRARQNWAGSGEKSEDALWNSIKEEYGATEFFIDRAEIIGKIICILHNGQLLKQSSANNAPLTIKSTYSPQNTDHNSAETIVDIVLDKTCFYGESGGQIGDTGQLLNTNDTHYNDTAPNAQKHTTTGIIGKVINTYKAAGGSIIVHRVRLDADVALGDTVICKIDSERRKQISANHSATHILNHSLRTILGDHVAQKGSLVTEHRLRFDFTHNQKLSDDILMQVENAVNDAIMNNTPLSIETIKYDEAKTRQINAMFDEKYGEWVRVVSFGNAIELCGGSHVTSTGKIGMFKIISEESIASGIRRIEAVTGNAAVAFIQTQEEILRNIMRTLKCGQDDVHDKIIALLHEKKENEKALHKMRIDHAVHTGARADIQLQNNTDIKAQIIECINITPSCAKDIANKVLGSVDILVIVFRDASQLSEDSLASAAVFASKKAIADDRFTASRIIQILKEKFGGSGGGNKAFGQIGKCSSPSINEISDALSKQI